MLREDGQGRVKTQLLPFFCLPKNDNTEAEELADSSDADQVESEHGNWDQYASSASNRHSEQPEGSASISRRRKRKNQAIAHPHCKQQQPQCQRKAPGWMATGQGVI